MGGRAGNGAGGEEAGLPDVKGFREFREQEGSPDREKF